MIRLGMSASDNPISAIQPLITLRNLDSDGSMFIYNGDANTLSDAIFTFPQDPSFTSYVADVNRLYFVNSNIFYSSSVDGSTLATRIADECASSSSNLDYLESIDKFILGDASDWVNTGLRL
jgi:hypothetical protein